MGDGKSKEEALALRERLAEFGAGPAAVDADETTLAKLGAKRAASLERIHEAGRRTARERIEGLVYAGSFV